MLITKIKLIVTSPNYTTFHKDVLVVSTDFARASGRFNWRKIVATLQKCLQLVDLVSQSTGKTFHRWARKTRPIIPPVANRSCSTSDKKLHIIRLSDQHYSELCI